MHPKDGPCAVCQSADRVRRDVAAGCLRIAVGILNATYMIWAMWLTVLTMQSGSSPVTPELYGHLVYSIPALVWFGAQFVGASVGFAGAWIGGGVGLNLMALGGCMIAVVFTFFAQAAGFASLGVIVQTGSIFHAVPLSIATIIACAYVKWWMLDV